MHVYKPKIFNPWALFAPIDFVEWEKSLGERAQTKFFNQRGSNTTLRKKLFPKPKCSREEPFHLSWNSCFINSTISSLHLKPHSIILWTFFIGLYMDRQTHPYLHFTCQSKLMNFTWFWIKTWFLVIWHAQLNFNIHDSKLKTFGQIFSFAHEIHRLASVTSMLVLASNLHKFWWNLVDILFTS